MGFAVKLCPQKCSKVCSQSFSMRARGVPPSAPGTIINELQEIESCTSLCFDPYARRNRFPNRDPSSADSVLGRGRSSARVVACFLLTWIFSREFSRSVLVIFQHRLGTRPATAHSIWHCSSFDESMMLRSCLQT